MALAAHHCARDGLARPVADRGGRRRFGDPAAASRAGRGARGAGSARGRLRYDPARTLDGGRRGTHAEAERPDGASRDRDPAGATVINLGHRTARLQDAAPCRRGRGQGPSRRPPRLYPRPRHSGASRGGRGGTSRRAAGWRWIRRGIVVVRAARSRCSSRSSCSGSRGRRSCTPIPAFPSTSRSSSGAGRRRSPIPLLESQDFSFDAEAVLANVTPATRLIILNTPGQPHRRGGPRSARSTSSRRALAEHPDVAVLSDEIYCRIIYGDREHASPPRLPRDCRSRHPPRRMEARPSR